MLGTLQVSIKDIIQNLLSNCSGDDEALMAYSQCNLSKVFFDVSNTNLKKSSCPKRFLAISDSQTVHYALASIAKLKTDPEYLNSFMDAIAGENLINLVVYADPSFKKKPKEQFLI